MEPERWCALPWLLVDSRGETTRVGRRSDRYVRSRMSAAHPVPMHRMEPVEISERRCDMGEMMEQKGLRCKHLIAWVLRKK